jgi:hypothetical protein
MLTATALAVVGIPQGAPLKVTVRAVLSGSGELGLRESYCRQGTSGMNGMGGAASVSAVRPEGGEL